MKKYDGIDIRQCGDNVGYKIAAGVDHASIRTAEHNRPISVTFWAEQGFGVRFESVMHDLTDRTEIGVLSTKLVTAPLADEQGVIVPKEFNQNISLAKLTIETNSVRVESGVVLTGSGGQEILIVAGAYPFTLAILGLGDVPHRFEPEYPVSEYKIHWD